MQAFARAVGLAALALALTSVPGVAWAQWQGGGSHGGGGGGGHGGGGSWHGGGGHGGGGHGGGSWHGGGGHGHGHGGTDFVIGFGPWWGWGPWWYGPGYWYGYPAWPVYAPPVYAPAYPPQVVVQEPPVYVERAPQPAAPPAYWYYCQSAGAYYPDVQSCPEPWMKVPPRAE